MDYDKLLQEAILKTDELLSGTTFTLRNLFVGVFWDSLETGSRLELGRRFKHAVITGGVPNVVYIRKAQNNSALYQKQ